MSEVAPFKIRVPQSALRDLSTRLRATRWTEEAGESSWEAGPPLPFVRSLCDFWANNFDWREFESRINRQPQLTTEIDGIRLHAIHRRSGQSGAIPVVLIHGWPGSFTEYLALCQPLTEPASGSPAFHVVAPSLPGYGFSTTRPGVTPKKIASYFVTLMERLGYQRFMIQGGNWGSIIGTEMARQFPARVIGLHLSSVNVTPPADSQSLEISEEERSWITDHASFPHFALLSKKPASAAYALNDSPSGLAAWIGEKLYDWTDNGESGEPALSQEQMLQIISLYWFTGTIGSSMRLYYEHMGDVPHDRVVTIPTAAALFPKSVAKAPRSWAERYYNIVRWSVFERGGHFPAMEVPDLLINDIRAFAGMIGERV